MDVHPLISRMNLDGQVCAFLWAQAQWTQTNLTWMSPSLALSLSHTHRKPGAQCKFCSVGKLMRVRVRKRRGNTVVMTMGTGSRWRARLTPLGNKHTHSGGTTLYCRQETLRPASLSIGIKVVPHTDTHFMLWKKRFTHLLTSSTERGKKKGRYKWRE